MRARSRPVLVIATALIIIVMGAGIAEAQMDTGESYWGEHMIDGIVHLWPAVAIAILTGLVAGGMLGLYELDCASILLMLAASAFLAYHFYWQPAHPASGQSPDLQPPYRIALRAHS
jgi:hypothetical protein